MAINFAAYAVRPYIGVPYAIPYVNRADRVIRLQNDRANIVNEDRNNLAVTNINWVSYGAAVNARLGVKINLQQASGKVGSVINRIEGVVIDNTASEVNIYVRFEDTGYVVTCPPNSTVSVFALTNLKEATVYGDGFALNSAPQTNVYFLEKYIDYYNVQTFEPDVPDVIITTLDVDSANNTNQIANIDMGPSQARVLVLRLAYRGGSALAFGALPTLGGIAATTNLGAQSFGGGGSFIGTYIGLWVLTAAQASGNQTLVYPTQAATFGTMYANLSRLENLLDETGPIGTKQGFNGINYTQALQKGSAILGHDAFWASGGLGGLQFAQAVVDAASTYNITGTGALAANYVWSGISQTSLLGTTGGPVFPNSVAQVTTWR